MNLQADFMSWKHVPKQISALQDRDCLVFLLVERREGTSARIRLIIWSAAITRDD